MDHTNNSYFARHKLTLKQSRNFKKKPQGQIDKVVSLEKQEVKIQEKVVNTIKSKEAMDLLSYAFNQEKSQEEKIYEQYKNISTKYNQQLEELQREIESLKKEQEMEKKKIKQAEVSLQSKKKELKLAKQRFQETQSKLHAQRNRRPKENKIQELESKLKLLNEQNSTTIKGLLEEYSKAEEENQKLKKKIQQAQEEYKKCLEIDMGDYEAHKSRLEEEEAQLDQELKQLEAQSLKIKRDIDKIQKMKPVSTDVHKRYLQLFQKMFISKEISKAERIMSLKEQQKKQNQELARRREWLKDKQMEINTRERRIADKNQTIDSLTQEIKQKSTLLLKKYHEEGSRTPSGKK